MPDAKRELNVLRLCLLFASLVWVAASALLTAPAFAQTLTGGSPLLGCPTAIGSNQVYNPCDWDSKNIMWAIQNAHPDLDTVAVHRGIHALAGTTQAPNVPENSLQAIGFAAQEGWEAIEIDVKLTSDNVPIMSHDKTWGREWCGKGSSFNATYYDPFIPPGNANNDAANPPVAATSLSNTRSFVGHTVLRDSVNLITDTGSHGCGGPLTSGVYPPTLADVYSYIKQNNIQMLVVLDIQSRAIATEAWKVVQQSTDGLGRPSSQSTMMKIPAVLFGSGQTGQAAITDYLNTFGGTYNELNFNPVFHTSKIAPAPNPQETDDVDSVHEEAADPTYGSEQAMIDWLNTMRNYQGINVAAVEVSMKDPLPNGVLSKVLPAAQMIDPNTGKPTVTISQFNPVGEYYPNGDTKQIPQFFRSADGSCCTVLSDLLWNNPATNPNNKPGQPPVSQWPGLPYDHADNRPFPQFLINDVGAQHITTDLPSAFLIYLQQQPRQLRNINYMTAGGPPGYHYCASEGSSCTFKANGDIAYGPAQGPWYYQNVGAANYRCSIAGFGGDPAPGMIKLCYYKPLASGSSGGGGNSGGGSASPVGSDPLPPSTPGETSTRRPDPSAISVNGTFYSVESDEDTNPAHNTIWLRSASGLAGLANAIAVPIFTDTAGVGELWAPEIMYIDGKYYVYFTMGFGSGHRMYAISSANPDHGYSAPQRLMLPDDKWAIDGTTFVFNSQRWFAWSGWPANTDGEQDIYIAKMSDPVTPFGQRYQVSQPREPWEQKTGSPLINEGIEAIKDPNGQLHIVYSANGSWSDQYCLGDLRLKSGGDLTYVWDWHKSNGCEFGSNGGNMEPNGWYPMLYANGPGHHTFALPDGDINKSPNAAYPATAQFMYHAVPKGLNYKWANRVRYVGAYTWYNHINYNRCNVPGDNTDTGYSLMFFEDPNFVPHPSPLGPPPVSCAASAPTPGATGIHNADPSVIRNGGTYISVETGNNETAILLRQASSPGALGQAPPTVLEQLLSIVKAVWAPEIQIINNDYYVYFSADVGKGHRMFYRRYNSNWAFLEGQQLSLPDDQWAVDGNAFVFNGQRYFVWSGVEADDPNEQNLYLVKMSDPGTPTGPRYRISQPHEPWERATGGPPNNWINEAPAAIIDPDGRLHITYSANGSWTDQYCIADLRLVAGGDPTNVWDWHKSNGCQFGPNRTNIAPGYDPTLYVDGPGSHSFVLLNGDVGTSPPAGLTFPFMYHAVPKGTTYSWSNRMWFNGAFQWYHGPNYTRCCVPGSTNDAGWSIKFYEDPNFGK